MFLKTTTALMFAATMLTGAAFAQPAKNGPVASACATEISKYCSADKHDGAVRQCLEGKRAKLSAKCTAALDNTRGAGRRR